MISFFRRALSSWIVLGLLGLIMIAFIVTGVGTPGGLEQLGGGPSGDTIAKVGGTRLSTVEVTQRAQLAQQNAAQENPGLDMPTFVRQGAFDALVEQLIGGAALETWAREQGLSASKRLIDGEIASIPAFHGPTGQFEETAYRNALAQRRMSEAQLRRDIAGDLIRRQLLVPIGGGSRAPTGIATPYAELMLEARKGEVGIVPTALIPVGAAPTEAEISGWYSRNAARYTMPERRVIRFALIGKDQLGEKGKVTDAEIAAFYKANAATYGATETRSFSQVILPDEAAAKALSASIKGGATFAAAAQKAGFSPTDTALGAKTRAELVELSSAAVADAAFAAPQGGTTSPIKTALGWHVLHIDSIQTKAARPLEAVRGEIAASLEKQKVDEAIADLISAIEDEIADGASFDDVVRNRKLTPVSTPPVLANGQAPETPTWKAPPELGVLLKTAFEVSSDEDPTVETIGNGQLHALLKVAQVIPAAPVPLARIRDKVIADLTVDRAARRAQDVAKAIKAKVDAGTPLAKAIADANLNLPAPKPAGGRQIDIARSGQQVPPPVALMFGMKQGTTRILEVPGKGGWFIVHLDSIEKGDIATAPGLVDATRAEFNGVMAQEYIASFVKAIETAVKVTRNDAAIAKLRRDLSGQ